eukprot:777178-Amorphochlora_amoeboformis.AAC.1
MLDRQLVEGYVDRYLDRYLNIAWLPILLRADTRSGIFAFTEGLQTKNTTFKHHKMNTGDCWISSEIAGDRLALLEITSSGTNRYYRALPGGNGASDFR